MEVGQDLTIAERVVVSHSSLLLVLYVYLNVGYSAARGRYFPATSTLLFANGYPIFHAQEPPIPQNGYEYFEAKFSDGPIRAFG